MFMEKTKPKPVSEMMPMTMPAQAQATATGRTPLTPVSNAEMLQLIQSAVRENSESKEEIRNWNEAQKIKLAK